MGEKKPKWEVLCLGYAFSSDLNFLCYLSTSDTVFEFYRSSVIVNIIFNYTMSYHWEWPHQAKFGR